MSSSPFEPVLDWINVPDPTDPPAGARPITAGDLLRYENGIKHVQDLVGNGGGGGGAGGTLITIDTYDEVQVVAYSNGSLSAIPTWEGPATTPLKPTVTAGSASILIEWMPTGTIQEVVLLRNGSQVYRGYGTRYVDMDVVDGQIYTYALIGFTGYGWRGDQGPGETGAADASLNIAPDVSVTTWPDPLPLRGRGLIRVNGLDSEAQRLVFTLTVNNGTATPTDDPSVWIYTAIER